MVSVGRGVECRVVLFGSKKLWDKWCRAPNAFYTVLYLRRCLGLIRWQNEKDAKRR